MKKQFKNERDNFMGSYDYVKDEVTYTLENKLESYEVHCNMLDLRVLTAFLQAYTDKLEKELSTAKIEDDEQLKLLKEITDQCEGLLSA